MSDEVQLQVLPSSQEPGDLTGPRTWSTWSAGAVISRTHPGPRGAAPFCYRRRVGSGQQIQEQYFKWTVLKRERGGGKEDEAMGRNRHVFVKN